MCRIPGRRGTLALSCAVLNKGAGFPAAGSPSQALRASSPKVGALGSPLSFPFYTLRPAAAKRAVRRCAHTSRLCQGLSLWERWHREAMTERASPLTGRQGLCLADAFGRERASPLTAAQSLGLDRAPDGAALPLGQDPQKNRPASVSSGRLGAPAGDAAQRVHQYLAGLLDRYFLTIKATLKTIASSNSRRSRPVSFLIFSRRYTSVLRWTNRPRLVSETFRLFSKKR